MVVSKWRWFFQALILISNKAQKDALEKIKSSQATFLRRRVKEAI